MKGARGRRGEKTGRHALSHVSAWPLNSAGNSARIEEVRTVFTLLKDLRPLIMANDVDKSSNLWKPFTWYQQISFRCAFFDGKFRLAANFRSRLPFCAFFPTFPYTPRSLSKVNKQFIYVVWRNGARFRPSKSRKNPRQHVINDIFRKKKNHNVLFFGRKLPRKS